MKKSIYILIYTLIVMMAGSCIEDGYTTSASDQPVFSTDTLDLGTVYTGVQAVTTRMTVHNPHSKGLNVSSVTLSGEAAEYFRLNVDGMAGTEFSDVEIRANDSIYVFVDCTLPENGDYSALTRIASIDFLVNGWVSSVIVTATGQDVKTINGAYITEDETWEAGVPYQIIDSLVVAENVTLTLEPGCRLLFHDDAEMIVRGTFKSMGTPEAPVVLTGDRTGEVIAGVSYDLMSRQWSGLDFYPSSSDNYMQYTEVSNTTYGIYVYGEDATDEALRLTMLNCKLRNSGDCVLTTLYASVEAYGCEFAEASYGLIYLVGGSHRFDQCTVANNYLYSTIGGPAWTFVQPEDNSYFSDITAARALVTNTITYGLGYDVTPGDFKGQEVYFKRCLFKSEGEDDDNFVDCLWAEAPLYYTVRSEYYFDYRLQPESPAIDAAYTGLRDSRLVDDYYGVTRSLELGAYSFVGL